MNTTTKDADLERLQRNGYVIVENILDEQNLAEVRAGLASYLGSHRGRNPFEGHTTERVYTLAARGRVFEDIATHPRILALVDAFLRPGYLLSVSHAINIHPGEKRQALHFDDSQFALPRPRPPITMGMILAIDPFTAENGGTVVVPGSHVWGGEELEVLTRAIQAGQPCNLLKDERPVEMPAGAALILQGTLIHGGGANQTDRPRLAVTNQYCQPWGRPQENFFLSVPRERVRGFSPRLQQLMGYDVWATFVGHVSSTHPRKSLAPGYVPPIVRQESRR
ncbi:MAG TPA: phytanoyl-CoA dioxygenase family protein [Caulobacteraceae bacterium]|jgi:ectoine hydroxylase-related dioxygenase (phytanoyl-CoA dioxygenase family)|nr:phytanoyl-CoA dioxygenase family protein [Caulobacteraceae bacterium]